MNAIRHGGFVSVFVEVPVHLYDTWETITHTENTLKELTNWHQPGGSVEVIRDRTMQGGPGRPSTWKYELVWYDRDIANATLFKLTYAGVNPLA